MLKIALRIMMLFALAVPTSEAEGERIKTDDLTKNLQLLNCCGKQPQHIQRLYEIAYKILSAKRDASFADVANDLQVQQLCKENSILHLGGPMLGAVTADGAKVWLRTLRPAEVTVGVIVDRNEKLFGPIKADFESDLTAVVPITGLKPETRYPYRVLVDGKPIPIPDHATITTAPEEATHGKVRVAFGTCFHRDGLGHKKQADTLLSRCPTALLLYGDIAVANRNNHLGLHRADYLLRDFYPAWQSLVAAIPVYATWDDHDYFDDDLAGIPDGYTRQDKEEVWEVFRHAWNNPSYGFSDERRGVFLRTRIGPCDIIMADNRYFRSGKKGSFLGDDQMKWLEAQLLDCRGPFIILSCGTMWSDYVSNGKDSWGRWDPKGRERIFSLIETHRIAGVLLISGDRHGARGFHIPRPSGYSFYEFESASLGARIGPPATKPEWDTQLYGISGKHAFSEFTIDATVSDPEVTFRLIQDNGNVIHEMKLTRSQLTPLRNEW